MKGFSLSKHFKACAVSGAAVVAVTTGLLGSCTLVQKFADVSGSCISADQTSGFNTAARQNLRDVAGLAGQSPTGRYIMNDLKKAGTMICYEEDLNKPDSCGGVSVGVFYGSWNRAGLNPAYSKAKSAATLVHEGRHKQQDDRNIDWGERGNIRDEDRIILKWATEADSRVASIVYAWEMAQQGEQTFMDRLKRDSWYSHMVTAFETSLIRQPGNMQEAMRKAFRAFRDERRLARSYDNKALDWIEKQGLHHDLSRRTDELLTKGLLNRLGDMGPHGNYMNDDLIAFIRASFTVEDYRQLLSDRSVSRPGFNGLQAKCG